MLPQVGGIFVDQVGAGAFQLRLSVAAAKQTYAQGFRAARASGSQTLFPTMIESLIGMRSRSEASMKRSGSGFASFTSSPVTTWE